MAAAKTGQIVRKVEDRGFGFIRPPSGTDVFFHLSGLADGLKFDDLQVDDEVSFDTEDAAKGPRAINIRRL